MMLNRTNRKNRKTAGMCKCVNAVAVDVLCAMNDVRVSCFRTFVFFKGLDKRKPDDC